MTRTRICQSASSKVLLTRVFLFTLRNRFSFSVVFIIGQSLNRISDCSQNVLTNSLYPVFLRRLSTSLFEIPCLISASSHYRSRQWQFRSMTIQLTAYVVWNLHSAVRALLFWAADPNLPPRFLGLITTLHRHDRFPSRTFIV